MATPAAPLHVRVFLSSPGDVADERGIALQLLERIQYDPLLRGRLTIEAVAWDKPGAGTPLLATLTPQEAIDQGLPKPSECDIVVVIFWSRMGTPLPQEYSKPDGHHYNRERNGNTRRRWKGRGNVANPKLSSTGGPRKCCWTRRIRRLPRSTNSGSESKHFLRRL